MWALCNVEQRPPLFDFATAGLLRDVYAAQSTQAPAGAGTAAQQVADDAGLHDQGRSDASEAAGADDALRQTTDPELLHLPKSPNAELELIANAKEKHQELMPDVTSMVATSPSASVFPRACSTHPPPPCRPDFPAWPLRQPPSQSRTLTPPLEPAANCHAQHEPRAHSAAIGP